MGGVLDAANAIPQDASKALLIFDNLVTILNVDVNVTGINNDAAVSPIPKHMYICTLKVAVVSVIQDVVLAVASHATCCKNCADVCSV